MTEPESHVVHAALNYVAQMSERPQFHANDQSLDRLTLDCRTVPIRNARAESQAPTLEREGLQLFNCPTRVAEFRDNAQVARLYPNEIREFMLALTGADAVVITGPPILRFAERSGEAGTRDNSRAARLVHIDVSEKAAADFAAMATPRDARPIRRTAQHNIWRTFSPAPQDVPLAVCDARTVHLHDLVAADANFDQHGAIVRSFEALLLRHNADHRWLYFPDMRRDEVIVFKRHDTDPAQPHQVPHSAFSDPEARTDAVPRASVEMRTVAYWYA